MRSRVSLFVFLFFVGSLALPLAAHAGVPFFGPIIPQPNNQAVCPASWAMLITVINNLISLLITLTIVLVAPLMIAWSGFLFVVNPVHAAGREQAKKILTNTIVGIVIALASWMIVDAVMAVLYNQNTPNGSGGGVIGIWSDLITSGTGPTCLSQEGALPGAALSQAPVASVTTTGGTLSTSISTVPGDACNPATIMAAVPSANTTQANLLACIAHGESTCGTSHPPYNLNSSWGKATPNGKASTAAGAYQVLLSSNHNCYENKACYTAAGVSGKLNCQNAFDSNGFPIPGATLTNCENAAGNVACSAAAAVCLLNSGQSFSTAYATDPYMTSCQSQYHG
ncbi:MAG TPA: pilin [Candidatus Paceibacterota bacterium]|nr:pilin [Candidatus Paceibacterota bacterium]